MVFIINFLTVLIFRQSFLELEFWKQSARKVCAVALEDEASASKRFKEEPPNDESFLELKECIFFLLKLRKDTKVTLGLKNLLNDAFKCKICQMIMKPHIIYSGCCCTIIGCEVCVNKWYSNSGATGNDMLSKACPFCNSTRGLSNTYRITGLDKVLEGVAPIFED